jgi:hypothetical protein
LIWTRKKDSVSRNPWAGPIEPIVDAGLYGVNVRSQGDPGGKISFSELYPKFRIERDYFSELALRTHQGAQMKIVDLQEARTTQRRPALDMGLIRFGDIAISWVLRNVSEGGQHSTSDRKSASRTNSH